MLDIAKACISHIGAPYNKLTIPATRHHFRLQILAESE